jgi:hypothetical protein
MTALPNRPVTEYVPAGSGIVASCPAETVCAALVAPVARSVTVMLPAPGVPERDSHRGADRNRCGPPSRYRPLTNSVGPRDRNGSPAGGPQAPEPEHSGLSQTVISRPWWPAGRLCLRMVWISGCSTAASLIRNSHPAFFARSRATARTRRVTRGNRHPAGAAPALPEESLGTPTSGATTSRAVIAPIQAQRRSLGRRTFISSHAVKRLDPLVVPAVAVRVRRSTGVAG